MHVVRSLLLAVFHGGASVSLSGHLLIDIGLFLLFEYEKQNA